MATMQTDTLRAALRLLAASWAEIDFEYESLTKTEQTLITADQFDEVLQTMTALGVTELHPRMVVR